jgi:hypothetical protein
MKYFKIRRINMEYKNKFVYLLLIIASIIVVLGAITVNADNISAVEQATYTDAWGTTNTLGGLITSTSWTTLPGTSMTITTKFPSDIAITFSSEVGVSANNRIYIRALIDGVPAGPGDIIFYGRHGEDSDWQSRSFIFLKTNVASGTHTVKIQTRITTTGGRGSYGDRTLLVVANGAGH